MKFIKKVICWLLLFIQSFISVLKIMRYNNIMNYNKINTYFKYLEKNQILKILGNGESLNQQSENLLNESCDYLVVNRHVFSPMYIDIKPKYYVLADPHFFIHPEGLSVIEKINQLTLWEMSFFVPYSKQVGKVVSEIVTNKNITLVFYNHIDFKGFPKLKLYLEKKNICMPRAQNVIVAAIYLGICGNYKKIELYGVEHSWMKLLSVNNNNEVCLENPHFFDKEMAQPKSWKEIHHSDAKMYEVLRLYAFMFEAYWELKKLSLDKNVKVINCTENSFIDAFDRNYEKMD